MIVKNKFKGMAADEKIIFGYFRPGGISSTSRLNYWTHFYEKFIIRKDNNQNKYFLIILIFLKIIRDFKMLKNIKLKEFREFIFKIID